MISEDSIPMIFQGNFFHPICKSAFAENEVNLFCRQLGHQFGKIIKSDVTLIAGALKVGICVAGDEKLFGCSGGGNTHEIGVGNCASKNPYGMKVICTGGVGRSHSCKSKLISFNDNLSLTIMILRLGMGLGRPFTPAMRNILNICLNLPHA